jgi:hypothetical protein
MPVGVEILTIQVSMSKECNECGSRTNKPVFVDVGSEVDVIGSSGSKDEEVDEGIDGW